MTCTVYADASLKTIENKVDGHFGIWVKSILGTIKDHGDIPLEYCQDIQVCELYAVYRGMKSALETWPGKIEIFYIRSDNLSVVQALSSERLTFATPPWSKKIFDKLLFHIQDRCRVRGIKIQAKHVKAHTGRRDIRSYVNDQVDQLSKARSR